MPASGYFAIRLKELQNPDVIHSVKVRWYSSIKDLKDQLYRITNEPPSCQHIFHPSNPTEFRNSSTLHSLGIDHDGFILNVAFDDHVRAPFYLEPLKPELIHEAEAKLLEDVRMGFKRDKTPKATDELDGSGGVYFLRSNKGFYAAVFKPHDEEQGMPNNPKGYNGAGLIGLRDHFRPGQGCLREVAAYLLDYKHFCGVPPTALIHCQHPSFCYPSASGKRKLFPKLGSLQQFVKASECFDDIGPGQFSDLEIQKIALLDLRLLNCDRNAANMLVKYKRNLSESSDVGNGSNELSRERTDSEGNWILDCSPNSTSGEGDMYELIPIDHGYCMPSKLRIDGIDLAWLFLPQVKREVHPAIKEYVASLDFESLLFTVLEQIALPGNSIFLLALAHLLVVQGIASGLTLYDIATLVVRTEGDDQASKLEQAILEAEENAFRAIEMQSRRVPSHSAISDNSCAIATKRSSLSASPVPSAKASTQTSDPSETLMAERKNQTFGTTPDPLDNMGQKQPPNREVKLLELFNNTLNRTVGDGVWDVQSVIACASPMAFGKTSAADRDVSGKVISSDPLSAASPKGRSALTANFSILPVPNSSNELGIPLELDSEFLHDVILAACNDICSVATGSPTKRSPSRSIIAKSSSTSKNPPAISSLQASYLPTIDEERERRLRGYSAGSTCSSADNDGLTPSDPPAANDNMLNNNSFASEHLESSNSRCRDKLVSRNDVDAAAAVHFPTPPSTQAAVPALGRASILSSPKFLSALSDMHGSGHVEQGRDGCDMFNTIPLQGTELSRMRSIGPMASAPMKGSVGNSNQRPSPRFNSSSASHDSNAEGSIRSDSTFEAAGTGLAIDWDDESVDLRPASGLDRREFDRMDSRLQIPLSTITDKKLSIGIVKEETEDELSQKVCTKNSSFSELYSPLSRLLALPSDPNLSSSILEVCMHAGETDLEPILQPSLQKQTSKVGPKTPDLMDASIVDGFLDSSSRKKRKHELVASEMEAALPHHVFYSPETEERRVSEGRSHRGSRSESTAAVKQVPSLRAHDSTGDEENADEDLALLNNAPNMTRVASFSGFESAPIYDLVAEGRFGSLRQEKRKAIMKTPEFNKFRLHFAHEAVLSMIQRMAKQKS